MTKLKKLKIELQKIIDFKNNIGHDPDVDNERKNNLMRICCSDKIKYLNNEINKLKG